MRDILRFRVAAMVLLALGLFAGTFASVGAQTTTPDLVLVCNIRAQAGEGLVISVDASAANIQAQLTSGVLVRVPAGTVEGANCSTLFPSPTMAVSPTATTPVTPTATTPVTPTATTPVTPTATTPVTPTATTPATQTGNIAVFKTLCEEIGQQDTCMGREDLLEGFTIDFQIFEGEGTDGELVETVTVTLGENAGGGGNTGAGSQGRIVSGDLPVGTFTVCEVEVAIGPNGEEVGLEAFPRPTAGEGGSTGGTNQEQFGDNCIIVELTPGTAELKFLDLVADKDGETPVKTPVTPVKTPVTPVEDKDDNGKDNDGGGAVDDKDTGGDEVVDDKDTGGAAGDDGADGADGANGEAGAAGAAGGAGVSALPSTGQGVDAGTNGSAIVLLFGAMSLVALGAGFAWRQRHTA